MNEKRKLKRHCVLLTESEEQFITNMRKVTGNDFAKEVRAIIDDFIDFHDSADFEKCHDCRWHSRELKEKVT